ncbi:E3 ubiquitin-protein ligase mycbp2 [Mactra antiquata]
MKVDIVEGIIAEFQTDVIVNSANQALLLDLGNVSKSISILAGPGLQTECSTVYPNGINYGEVAVTQGHNLRCQRVYHVAIPSWDSEAFEPTLILGQSISRCLEQAHIDRVSSIAFPTLGSGFLGYPVEFIVDTFKQCIDTFENKHTETTLEYLQIVLYTKNLHWKPIKQAFEALLGNRHMNEQITSLFKRRRTTSVGERTGDNWCNNILPCRHKCLGFKDEMQCPPCLEVKCRSTDYCQTADDDCVICYTETLAESPLIQLKCGHVFHFNCTKRLLENKWVGARITFNFTLCPICKEPMDHPQLKPLLDPLMELQNAVTMKALMRLQYEGLLTSDQITNPSSPYYQKPQMFAMERYCYYPCFKCNQPYFGGAVQCDAGAVAESKLEDLVCSACSAPQIAQV